MAATEFVHDVNKEPDRNCCLSMLKEEFSRPYFTFQGVPRSWLSKCLWVSKCGDQKFGVAAFLAYRTIAALFSLSVWLSDIIQRPFYGTHFSLTYLTNWTFVVLTIYLVIAAFLSHAYYWGWSALRDPDDTSCVTPQAQDTEAGSASKDTESGKNYGTDKGGVKETGSGSAMQKGKVSDMLDKVDTAQGRTDKKFIEEGSVPVGLQLFWVLHQIATTGSILVTILYFGLLYTFDGTPINFYNLAVHGLNTVLVVTEVIAGCGVPVRLLHCVYTALYGAAYILFSSFYQLADPVTNVLYAGYLDWGAPVTTIIVGVMLIFVAIPFLQIIVFSLYKLQLFIHRSCCLRE